MRVRVTHSLGDLADDLRGIAARVEPEMSSAVLSAARVGNRRAQAWARAKAGPHGKNYYKRLSAEKTGTLQAEYGPEGIPKTEFVGVGFRSGGNDDLPRSAPVAADNLAREVRRGLDRWFW